MTRRSLIYLGCGGLLAAVLTGCFGGNRGFVFNDELEHYNQIALETEFEGAPTDSEMDALSTPPPISLSDPSAPEMWDLTLEETVRMALTNSKVLRDLGATVLRSPATTPTVYGPSLEVTDPRFGTEAALSAFDAQIGTRMFFAKNDRALNNFLIGGGTRLVDQDLAIFQTQISKTAATGSTFTLRHNMDYDANNAPGNLFPSAWNVNYEAEFRQPLMQGAGVDFNRIAGPDGAPGALRGIVLARLNSEISQADFEVAVRDFISNVENAYWDLYFAYRDLDAKRTARDASLHTWRIVKSWNETGKRGGEAEKEAQAREQYFRFEEQVQDALAGRLVEGTRTFNGSSGGTFRGAGGVQTAEKRLRLIVGLPMTDGKLIRPSDGPVMARVVFDWKTSLAEAITRRAELRRQRTVLRRSEMELVASRNFLLPRLDTVGLYRWRGFGDELLRTHRAGLGEFENAYKNLTGGDFQEWQLGVELSVPLGFRQGYAAVRNANLQLARERAMLKEQERQITHDLSAAVAEMDRALIVAQTAYNRRNAAQDQLRTSQIAWERGKAPVDLVLDAQQRLADAESRYHRTLVEYGLAVKNVHFEKGTLLDYNGVFLAESASQTCGDCPRGEAEDDLSYILEEIPAPVSASPIPEPVPPAPELP